MEKRIIALLLSIVPVVCMLPSAAFANETDAGLATLEALTAGEAATEQNSGNEIKLTAENEGGIMLRSTPAFSGVADRDVSPNAPFDALAGVTTSDENGSLDVVITTISSDDPSYTFTPGDTFIVVGNAGYTYSVTYNAYAPTDMLHATSLSTATRTLTSHAYAIGNLSVTSYNRLAATDTSYNLQSDTDGTLTMVYETVAPAKAHNTVLVLSVLEYGAAIETMATSDNSAVSDMKELDDHTLTIRMTMRAHFSLM